MNVTRSRVALVANAARLWAIGGEQRIRDVVGRGCLSVPVLFPGYDGMKNLSTVEVYNPETDEWTFVAPMESHEGGVGVGVIPLQD